MTQIEEYSCKRDLYDKIKRRVWYINPNNKVDFIFEGGMLIIYRDSVRTIYNEYKHYQKEYDLYYLEYLNKVLKKI